MAPLGSLFTSSFIKMATTTNAGEASTYVFRFSVYGHILVSPFPRLCACVCVCLCACACICSVSHRCLSISLSLCVFLSLALSLPAYCSCSDSSTRLAFCTLLPTSIHVCGFLCFSVCLSVSLSPPSLSRRPTCFSFFLSLACPVVHSSLSTPFILLFFLTSFLTVL